MADDIASLLAGAAKTNANFNFDEIPKAYWAGLEQAYKQRTRDAFQDPSLYNPDGSIDPAKAIAVGLKAGGLQGAESTSKIGESAIQQMYLGNALRSQREFEGGDGAATNAPPPSISQSGARKQAAPDLTQPDNRPQPAATPQPQQPQQPRPQPQQPQQTAGPFSKFLEAQNVPPEQHAQATLDIQKSIMELSGRPFDASKPLNMSPGAGPDQRPAVAEALRRFVINRATQQQPQQQAAAPGAGPGGAAAAIPPQPQAQPQQQQPPIVVTPQPQQPPPQPIQPRPVQTVPVAPPAPISPAEALLTPQEKARFGTPEAAADFYQRALRGGLPKGSTIADDYEKKLTALRAAMQPTEDQKKAAASGMTLPQYHAKQEKEKTDQTLLKEVDIPTLNTGKEKSTAANEEIKTYHEAKNILNQPGGIIAGAGADPVLAMAKIAGKYLNIPEAANAANRTEAFRAIMSGGVLQTVKQLGSGSGITNADVKFASDMVGKSISLDENSIRRIINLSEKVARRKIADHNAMVDKVVEANPALKERANVWRVEPAPLRIRVSKVPHVGDVRFGREYIGGKIDSDNSWIDAGGSPDTLRTP